MNMHDKTQSIWKFMPAVCTTIVAATFLYVVPTATAANGNTSESTSPMDASAPGVPRTNVKSTTAHEQLIAKAKAGGIVLYILSDSITRRWGCTDPPWSSLLANWNKNVFGWNAANFGWGADGIQNMIWRVQNGELAGVNPKVIVILVGTNDMGNQPGDDGASAIPLAPAPGDLITLDASGSHDPDGDQLTFSWWVLPEARTCANDVAIADGETSRATITIPSDAAGKSIHVICEVTDDGTPNLVSYRRINLEPAAMDAATPGVEASAAVPTATSRPVRQAGEKETEQENAAERPDARQRLRVIMMSDFPPIGVVKGGDAPNHMKSDPDDMQSMVRFLLYANEFDVEGLIASAGTFAMEAHNKNILDVIDRYELVYNNLKKRDPNYPTPPYLRSVTFEGKGNNHGLKIIWGQDKQPYTDIIGKGLDSEASRAIIAAADKPDPRPIWIGVWGGPREVAQAIWDVKHTRSEAELNAFLSKLRIFLIAYQDATHGWLMEQFPDLFIIESRKTYQGMFGGHDPLSDLAWVNEHIRNNHGPLGVIYPHEGMGCTGVCEGDSPAFLYLVSANRGINDPEDPTQPSWGGQYKREPNTNHYVDGPGGSSIARWRKEYQKDFQERADWMLP